MNRKTIKGTVTMLLIAVTGMVFIGLSGYNDFVTAATQETTVSAQTAYGLISENKHNKNFVILDIRTEEEFSQGHIKNAVNIDYFSPEFKNNLTNLDKNKTYLFHCKSGRRSGKSVSIFKELNFKNIVHMNGGFNEWSANNLPIVK